jgi:hypothetical protein
VPNKEQQQRTGWLARWRERRREKALRTAQTQHGAKEARHHDAERAARHTSGM